MHIQSAYHRLQNLLLKQVRNPWFIVFVFVGVGLLSLVLHHDMPIVRNSLLYAKIVYALSDNGSDFLVSEHAFNKALGFPVLSFPLVSIFGGNIGLKIASFIWTALWAVSLIFFYRRLERGFLWDDQSRPMMSLLLVVSLINPLVFYQFLSAYPDTLNAFTFLWSLYFLDRMMSKDSRWFDGLFFCIITLFALWAKHHGFILFLVLFIFGICRYRIFKWQWENSRINILIMFGAFLATLIVICLAQSGHITLFNLSNNKANFSNGFHELHRVIARNLLGSLKDYLWLSFTFITPLLFRWKRFFRYKEWYLTVLVFVATILIYHGARHNMRYFLPIAPLLVWIICNNFFVVNKQIRTVLLTVFLGCNLLFTLYYNSPDFKERTRFALGFQQYDNLRLVHDQYNEQKNIAAINKHLSEKRNTLFFVSNYYEDGMWHVWEREGLYSKKLEVIYLKCLSG